MLNKRLIGGGKEDLIFEETDFPSDLLNCPSLLHLDMLYRTNGALFANMLLCKAFCANWSQISQAIEFKGILSIEVNVTNQLGVVRFMTMLRFLPFALINLLEISDDDLLSCASPIV
jgi:hypothetical protein